MTEGVEDRRALHCYRRLFVSGQMGDRGSVQASPRVDVDGINNFVHILSTIAGMRRLILTCRREEKAAVRCKSQASKERRVGLIGVDAGVLNAEVAHEEWVG